MSDRCKGVRLGDDRINFGKSVAQATREKRLTVEGGGTNI